MSLLPAVRAARVRYDYAHAARTTEKGERRRTSIMALVERHPGITLIRLSRMAGFQSNVVRHHLHVLKRQKRLREESVCSIRRIERDGVLVAQSRTVVARHFYPATFANQASIVNRPGMAGGSHEENRRFVAEADGGR